MSTEAPRASKAFLSHSSKDKWLVDSVANQLGRQYCLYDRHTFETGEEFATAIQRCLNQADVFVLFASRESLQSIWVRFEQQEAFQRSLRKGIKHALVYIIEPGVDVHELPDWLQRSLVRRLTTAQAISKDIRLHLDRLLRERQPSYFVGRGNDVERLEELLTPMDGSPPPRAFVVWGLPGIGRRTLVKNVATNLLTLHKHAEIRLQEGDSVNDICIKLSDLTESFATHGEFKAAFNEMRSLDQTRALARIKKHLGTLVDSGELPMLIDEGGLLDSEGYINADVAAILRNLDRADPIYVAILTPRKPKPLAEVSLPLLQLKPLHSADSQRLLQHVAQGRQVSISNDQIRDIAEYTAGHPPSAYFAIEQAKQYGVQAVVGDKRQLVEFRSSTLLSHVQGLTLDAHEQLLLRVLASFSPLPIPAIVAVLGRDLEIAIRCVTKLIDMSLVIVDDDGLYRISDPIADTATQQLGFPSAAHAKVVAESIHEFMQDSSIDHRYLDLSRVLFRAARRSGHTALEGMSVSLTSDLIAFTEAHYHSRDYEACVRYGELAVNEKADSITARSYLIRGLIQLERWAPARHQLRELSRHAPPRDVHFLRGFLARRRGRYEEAIVEFNEAIRRGRHGAAVYREISQCYFLIGDYESARQSLRETLKHHGDNRYVVDLWAQLSIELGDEVEARQALERLKRIDTPLYYHFRRSRIEWRFGKSEDARAAIHSALRECNNPPFSVVAQSAVCDIATGHLTEAAASIEDLDRNFGGIKRDVRTGLRCKLELAHENYAAALALSERLENKNSRYYRVVRYDALTGAMAHTTIDLETSMRYAQETRALEILLAGDVRFDIPEFD